LIRDQLVVPYRIGRHFRGEKKGEEKRREGRGAASLLRPARPSLRVCSSALSAFASHSPGKKKGGGREGGKKKKKGRKAEKGGVFAGLLYFDLSLLRSISYSHLGKKKRKKKGGREEPLASSIAFRSDGG